jgi:hypothetical protein
MQKEEINVLNIISGCGGGTTSSSISNTMGEKRNRVTGKMGRI